MRGDNPWVAPDGDTYRREWSVAVVAGETLLGYEDWVLNRLGVEPPTPHTPPRMVDGNGLTDGVFTFYDRHETDNWTMEVVPQTTGNVEITIGESLFTLAHLDRADLIRALLHEFHYSPERGGPNDDI